MDFRNFPVDSRDEKNAHRLDEIRNCFEQNQSLGLLFALSWGSAAKHSCSAAKHLCVTSGQYQKEPIKNLCTSNSCSLSKKTWWASYNGGGLFAGLFTAENYQLKYARESPLHNSAIDLPQVDLINFRVEYVRPRSSRASDEFPRGPSGTK